MYKHLTAGMLVACLIPSGAAAASAAGLPASDQPIEIPGSFLAADGTPYKHVRWVARSTDGTITDAGITDASGRFAVLTSPASATEIIFKGYRSGNAPDEWESPDTDFNPGDSLFCRVDQWGNALGGVPLSISAGQTQFDVRAQPTHRSTVLVADKYGELVRNATVNPASAIDSWSWMTQSSKDWHSHNYAACGEPNQRFPVVSGAPSDVQLAGWIPGIQGGTTDSTGRAVIATPGPLDPDADFAVVRAGIRPGATQMTRITADSLEGSDPNNRVAVAVLPYAPIMEDAATAGPVPGEATGQMRAMSASETATVIVRQPSGQIVPNTEVQVVPVLDGDSPISPREGEVAATATTGSDGKATFAGLPTGAYRAIPVNISARTVDFQVIQSGTSTPPTTGTPPTTAARTVGVKGQGGQRTFQAEGRRQPEHGQGLLEVPSPAAAGERAPGSPWDLQDQGCCRDSHPQPEEGHVLRGGLLQVRLSEHHVNSGLPQEVARAASGPRDQRIEGP